MYKELIICIIIVFVIISLNTITQNYTKYSIQKMNSNLDIVKELVIEGNNEKTTEGLKKMREDWNETYEKLTYYLEHDELEKVSTKLANIGANIQTEEKAECIASIEECKYVLEHIREKLEFKIQNIF